jgi:TetR/AcrR family hemagglutinin/protease transcriptional regulator
MRAEESQPPRARTRAARLPPAERRAQLVASALGVFARLGLGAARHADVAAAARVSLPAVFHYFPTREALVAAVLDEIERFYLHQMAAAVAATRDGSPRDTLLAHGRAFARSVDTHPDHARVWLDWSTAVRDQLWRRYFRLSQRVDRGVTATIRRGQRDGSVAGDIVPEDAARLFVAAAYAVVQMKVAGFSDARVERFLESAVRAVVGRAG